MTHAISEPLGQTMKFVVYDFIYMGFGGMEDSAVLMEIGKQ